MARDGAVIRVGLAVGFAAGLLWFVQATALAQESGRLTVYSTQSDSVAKKVVAGFRKHYPKIEVTLLRLAGNAMTTRFANEARSGVNAADVLIIATPELFQRNPEWFLPLEGAGVANYESWPAKFKHPNYVAAVFSLHVIVYNKDTVSAADAPRTWEDLLKPRWKGHAVMLDPRASPTYMSWALNMQKRFGDAYLQGLSAQSLTLSNDGVGATQQVASGAADIAFATTPNQTSDLLAKGAPLAEVRVSSPTLGNEHDAGLPRRAPNPALGKLFLNWYLSPEGQGIACDNVSASALGRIPNCDPLPADFELPTFSISNAQAASITRLLGLN